MRAQRKLVSFDKLVFLNYRFHQFLEGKCVAVFMCDVVTIEFTLRWYVEQLSG